MVQEKSFYTYLINLLFDHKDDEEIQELILLTLKQVLYSKGNPLPPEAGGKNYFASFSIEKEVGDLIRRNQAAEILKDMSDADRMDFIRQMQIDLKDVPVQDRIEFIRQERLKFESQQEGSM